MKKKLSLLIISLLLCFDYVNAESINDRVTISASGATAKIGQHWVSASGAEYTTVKDDFVMDTKTYTGLEAAQEACRKATGSSDPNACVYSMQTVRNKCTLDGASNMLPDECRQHIATGTCTYDYRGHYKCDITGTSYNSSGECNSYCQSSCNNYCATDELRTVYKIGVRGNPNVSGSFNDKLKDSVVWEYLLNGSDRAYCIQPGKKGPSAAGETYCLNKEMNLKDCDDKLQNHYYCGLAQILYYTMIPSTDSNGNTIFTSNDAEYGFGAVTTALRMWTSYYGNVKGNPISGVDGVGFEQEFDYFSTTKVYLSTAKAAAGGYTGQECWQAKSDSNLGVLCGNLSGNNNYIAAIPLFNKALDMFNGNSSEKFLDGLLGTNDDKFQIEASKKDNGGASMVAKWPTSFIEQYERETTTKTYEVECTLDQLLKKDSRCRMYVQVFYTDANGNKVKVPQGDLSLVGGTCSKEKCELEVGGSMTCSTTETSESSMKKYIFEVTLKGYNSVGLIREYRHCINPSLYQIMYTAVFNKSQREESGPNSSTDKKFEKSVYSDCPCNDDTKCTDFNPVSKTLSGDLGQATCGNNYDGYDSFDKSDPYMNCILHPCKDSDKLQFRKTEEVGLNKNVCDLYCRKEVVFYLANKKKVYAGMQFRYDIGPSVLACEEDVTEIVRTDVALTSIVLQKQQCTSEIYYDTKNKYGNKNTWLQQYDAAVKKMMDAYVEWKKYESALSWEENNGGPHQVLIEGKQCYSGTGCPGDCSVGEYLPPIQWHLYWPTKGSSIPYKYCWVESGSEKGVNFNIRCSNGSYSTDSGVENESSSCYPTTCNHDYSCGENGTSCCGHDDGYGTSGSCNRGDPGDPAKASDDEDKYYKLYKSALDAVAQLIYDLQNCNMYVATGDTAPKIEDVYQNVSTEHHGTIAASINKSAKGSAKNILLDKAVCSDSNNDCAELKVEYEDELYGKNVTIEKETKTLPSEKLNKTYFCKNNDDRNPDCYKYVKGQEVELDKGNSLKDHDLIECEGTLNSVQCKKKKISLPTNDYASFVVVTETDFWRSDKFSAGAYTGEVGEAGRNGLTTPLGNEEYPVSNGLNTGGKTGNYTVKQHINNVKIVVDDNVSLDYTCSYDVYNTTNLYDCATRTSNGKLDLSACKNSCYKLVAGVPVITKECNEFELKDNESKGYGFVYRNIDLTNVFPNSVTSDQNDSNTTKNNRPIGTNWATTLGENVKTQIEQKGDDMFADESNLKYSFILTPTAISRIREYNTQQELMGVGYQDNSYLSCQLVNDPSGLNGFYKCKSSFLEEISQPNNSYDVETVKFSNP